MNFILWTFILFLVPSSVMAKGAKPPAVAKEAQSWRVSWVKDGVKKGMNMTYLDRRAHLAVSDCARLSNSQVQWQRVKKQACMTRVDGQMCFNWGENIISLDNKTVPHEERLCFKNNQLYIPSDFVASEAFQSFSQTEISFDPVRAILTQNNPVSLTMRPIQNLGEEYRLEIGMEKDVPYQVLTLTREKIWIRFKEGRFQQSQILEGDKIVPEVKINQKARGADVHIKLGRTVGDPTVQYDEGNKVLLIFVPTTTFPKRPQPKHQ